MSAELSRDGECFPVSSATLDSLSSEHNCCDSQLVFYTFPVAHSYYEVLSHILIDILERDFKKSTAPLIIMPSKGMAKIMQHYALTRQLTALQRCRFVHPLSFETVRPIYTLTPNTSTLVFRIIDWERRFYSFKSFLEWTQTLKKLGREEDSELWEKTISTPSSLFELIHNCEQLYAMRMMQGARRAIEPDLSGIHASRTHQLAIECYATVFEKTYRSLLGNRRTSQSYSDLNLEHSAGEPVLVVEPSTITQMLVKRMISDPGVGKVHVLFSSFLVPEASKIRQCLNNAKTVGDLHIHWGAHVQSLLHDHSHSAKRLNTLFHADLQTFYVKRQELFTLALLPEPSMHLWSVLSSTERDKIVYEGSETLELFECQTRIQEKLWILNVLKNLPKQETIAILCKDSEFLSSLSTLLVQHGLSHRTNVPTALIHTEYGTILTTIARYVTFGSGNDALRLLNHPKLAKLFSYSSFKMTALSESCFFKEILFTYTECQSVAEIDSSIQNLFISLSDTHPQAKAIDELKALHRLIHPLLTELCRDAEIDPLNCLKQLVDVTLALIGQVHGEIMFDAKSAQVLNGISKTLTRLMSKKRCTFQIPREQFYEFCWSALHCLSADSEMDSDHSDVLNSRISLSLVQLNTCLDADVTLFACMNEDVWDSSDEAKSVFYRICLKECGLSRRDDQMVLTQLLLHTLTSKRVVFTRSKISNGHNTVSAWILRRLEAFFGNQAWSCFRQKTMSLHQELGCDRNRSLEAQPSVDHDQEAPNRHELHKITKTSLTAPIAALSLRKACLVFHDPVKFYYTNLCGLYRAPYTYTMRRRFSVANLIEEIWNDLTRVCVPETIDQFVKEGVLCMDVLQRYRSSFLRLQQMVPKHHLHSWTSSIQESMEHYLQWESIRSPNLYSVQFDQPIQKVLDLGVQPLPVHTRLSRFEVHHSGHQYLIFPRFLSPTNISHDVYMMLTALWGLAEGMIAPESPLSVIVLEFEQNDPYFKSRTLFDCEAFHSSSDIYLKAQKLEQDLVNSLTNLRQNPDEILNTVQLRLHCTREEHLLEYFIRKVRK